MPPWSYSNPVKIHFGWGLFEKIGELTEGAKALLLTSPGALNRGLVDTCSGALGNRLATVFSQITPNPTFIALNKAFAGLKGHDYDVIIALGGGSVMDSAKALACMLAADKADWLDLHVKQSSPPELAFTPKPIIAVPTTAGTGSEVTRWGTLWDFVEQKKYSVCHPRLYPQKALLDPQLTMSLPRSETLYGGLDALSHSMEALWNKNANPVSDLYAHKAATTVLATLPRLLASPQDGALREEMLRASLLAGLAFSNTSTALAHSISYYMTTHYSLPHGLACSFCLPFVLKANIAVNSGRDGVLFDIFQDYGDNPIGSLLQFLSAVGVKQKFADYGISFNEGRRIIEDALRGMRGVNNLATPDHVLQVYEEAFGDLI
jgi:phosphonate metabolism-associated iron-containing alcohol dehydrogenase